MKNNNLIITVALIIFGLGIAHNVLYTRKEVLEGYSGGRVCPNLLVKKGGKFVLVNTNLKEIPGVNPVEFDSLGEYAVFVKHQKENGVRCPVLYFEEAYDAQSNRGYRQYSDPLNKEGGAASYKEAIAHKEEDMMMTDANRDNPPYNQNNYAGYDADDQEIGLVTPLDNVKSPYKPSPNPMAKNWGGHEFTDKLLKMGVFKGRTREQK
tara:strand:- start:1036 stop:1659 length:624 start_codon:yes stop_codon:yes gene_type:complete